MCCCQHFPVDLCLKDLSINVSGVLRSPAIIVLVSVLYSVLCSSPLHLVLHLGFYLVPSFGTYFFVVSFCPRLCVYLYILARSVTFSSLGEKNLRSRFQWVPVTHSPLDTRDILSILVCPLCGLNGPICCSGTNYCECAGWQGCFPAQLAASPALCVCCQSLVGTFWSWDG